MGTKRKRLTASEVNDYLFMAFPLGWGAGLIAGMIYAGFQWDNLQAELGRTLLVAVTTAQGVTLAYVTLKVRRLVHSL